MQTLIALYETEDIARRVETDLLGAGVAQDNIRVEGGVYEDAARPTGGLAGFFRWLFGSDPANDSDVYAESLRRGDWAVIVQLEDRLTDQVENILYSYNPIDVDARGAYFRGTGWKGYEEGASTYTTDEMLRDRNDYNSMYSRTYGADLPSGYNIPPETGVDEDWEDRADTSDAERSDMSKREIERGRVRVRTYLTERPVDGDTQPNRS